MPPRFRPNQTASRPAAAATPSGSYVDDLSHYLRAECGMAENSVKAYIRDLEQFLDWLKKKHWHDVRELTLQQLTPYLKHLHDEGLKASTVARKLVALKTFFRFLVLEGVITDSKAELLNSPKLWQYLPKVLSPEKVDALLTAPSWEDEFPHRDRAILSVLYATGCRASEVTDLTLDQVRLDEGYCKCRGKGNKERIVSLNPVAIAALETYLQRERPALAARHEQTHLFLSRTGRPLDRLTIWRIVKRYAARIGCSAQVSPHTLRHSFATHMLAGGAEIRALQEMLGHANIRTTQVYTHVEHSRLKSIHRDCHPRG